ncbi:prepilin-type N-terminal cleavage/methylation domain-containing protein [Patescibacteria group bacterium]|nr:prepilin-type N-terminal cleavage/methylation domain-containing protein [Patescibacteria group bacterium]
MKFKNLHAAAFTLVELLIVITLLAIMSAGILVNFNAGQDKAKFKDHQTNIINMFQQARAYAMSNRTINDVEVEYYYVEINELAIYIYGKDVNGLLTEIKDFQFEGTIYPDNEFFVYYFPPNAKACFNADCTSGVATKTFTLHSTNTDYTQTISIDRLSGFPELTGGEI